MVTERASRWLGKKVRAFTATGNSTHAVGRVVSYCDAPTVVIEAPNGLQTSWRADLCEVLAGGRTLKAEGYPLQSSIENAPEHTLQETMEEIVADNERANAIDVDALLQRIRMLEREARQSALRGMHLQAFRAVRREIEDLRGK